MRRVVSIGDPLLSLQVAAASDADTYLDEVLAAQGADMASEGAVAPATFADTADGGGSWLRTLVYAPASVAEAEARAGERTRLRAEWVARTIVLTGMQDTGRAAVQTAMTARPAVRGYVRMLVPPSCARCAVLAGRVYRSATAFKRHRRCDCRHVPSAENASDWSTSPRRYFRSLSTEDQDDIFGDANAEAIRLGADISQVVNAEEGVTVVAGVRGQIVTSRSLAGQRSGLVNGATFRPLPDEIFQAADQAGWDRVETLRQLRRFGYVI